MSLSAPKILSNRSIESVSRKGCATLLPLKDRETGLYNIYSFNEKSGILTGIVRKQKRKCWTVDFDISSNLKLPPELWVKIFSILIEDYIRDREFVEASKLVYVTKSMMNHVYRWLCNMPLSGAFLTKARRIANSFMLLIHVAEFLYQPAWREDGEYKSGPFELSISFTQNIWGDDLVYPWQYDEGSPIMMDIIDSTKISLDHQPAFPFRTGPREIDCATVVGVSRRGIIYAKAVYWPLIVISITRNRSYTSVDIDGESWRSFQRFCQLAFGDNCVIMFDYSRCVPNGESPLINAVGNL